MTNPENYIEVNGQRTGLYFGYDAFKDLISSGIEDIKYLNIQDISGYAKLLEVSHHNWCLLEKVKPSLSYKDFYLWVESKVNEDEKTELESLINIWADCTSTKKSLEKLNAQAEEQKKSLIAV